MDDQTDVTSMREVRAAALNAPPGALVYAGWRDADDTAASPEIFAHLAEAVIGIGAAALELERPLVFISHPRVFGGLAVRWGEEDTPVPDDEVGEAWLRGEQFALRTVPARTLIVRAGPVVPRHPREAAATLARLGRQGDRRITPISDADLARGIQALVAAGTTGVVHLAGPETTEHELWSSVAQALERSAPQLGGPERPSWALRSHRAESIVGEVLAPELEGGPSPAEALAKVSLAAPAPTSSVRISTHWNEELPIGETRLSSSLSLVRLGPGDPFELRAGQRLWIRSGKVVLEIDGEDDRVLRSGLRLDLTREGRVVAVAATEAIFDRGRPG